MPSNKLKATLPLLVALASALSLDTTTVNESHSATYDQWVESIIDVARAYYPNDREVQDLDKYRAFDPSNPTSFTSEQDIVDLFTYAQGLGFTFMDFIGDQDPSIVNDVNL